MPNLNGFRVLRNCRRHLRSALAAHRCDPAVKDIRCGAIELRLARIDIDGNIVIALWGVDLVKAGFIQLYLLRPCRVG